MALLPNAFVPDETDEDPFAPIEAGWYTAEITKSEVKQTRNKDGSYISFCFTVLDDEQYSGRMIWNNINIQNPSDMAVKIGRADLKKICKAVGHPGELEDTDDIHNIPLQIKVSIKPETPQWPARNEIKNYKAE